MRVFQGPRLIRHFDLSHPGSDNDKYILRLSTRIRIRSVLKKTVFEVAGYVWTQAVFSYGLDRS